MAYNQETVEYFKNAILNVPDFDEEKLYDGLANMFDKADLESLIKELNSTILQRLAMDGTNIDEYISSTGDGNTSDINNNIVNYTEDDIRDERRGINKASRFNEKLYYEELIEYYGEESAKSLIKILEPELSKRRTGQNIFELIEKAKSKIDSLRHEIRGQAFENANNYLKPIMKDVYEILSKQYKNQAKFGTITYDKIDNLSAKDIDRYINIADQYKKEIYNFLGNDFTYDGIHLYIYENRGKLNKAQIDNLESIREMLKLNIINKKRNIDKKIYDRLKFLRTMHDGNFSANKEEHNKIATKLAYIKNVSDKGIRPHFNADIIQLNSSLDDLGLKDMYGLNKAKFDGTYGLKKLDETAFDDFYSNIADISDELGDSFDAYNPEYREKLDNIMKHILVDQDTFNTNIKIIKRNQEIREESGIKLEAQNILKPPHINDVKTDKAIQAGDEPVDIDPVLLEEVSLHDLFETDLEPDDETPYLENFDKNASLVNGKYHFNNVNAYDYNEYEEPSLDVNEVDTTPEPYDLYGDIPEIDNTPEPYEEIPEIDNTSEPLEDIPDLDVVKMPYAEISAIAQRKYRINKRRDEVKNRIEKARAEREAKKAQSAFNSKSHDIHNKYFSSGSYDNKLSDYYKDQVAQAEADSILLAQSQAEQDHDADLNRIREDAKSKSMSKILRAFGINVPDSIFEQDTKYRRADEDRKKILGRAETEHRELTDAEQKQVKQLEKTMAQYENIHDILSRFPPNLQQIVDTGAILITTFILMNKAGQESIDAFKKLNNELVVVGEGNATGSLIGNSQYRAEKNWDEFRKNITAQFQGITALLAVGNEFLSGIAMEISDVGSVSASDIHSEQFGWYTRTMQAPGLTVSDMNSDLTKFAAAFMNQGADIDTAGNMAVKLHNIIVTSDNYKKLSDAAAKEDMMQSVLDAVVNGGSYSEYGVKTSTNALTGYLIDSGIDKVNVQISDLMESYYRLDLVQYQLSENNKERVSQDTKNWEQLGMEIEASKNKLLSFDKELVLGAVESHMPTVGKPLIYDLDGNVHGGLDYTKEKLAETYTMLEEYINLMAETPEEKETLMSLIDTEAEMQLATYLNELGLTPEQILTVLEVWNKNPEAIREILEDFGLYEEQINTATEHTEEYKDKIKSTTDEAIKFADEMHNTATATEESTNNIKNSFKDMLVKILQSINDFFNDSYIIDFIKFFGGYGSYFVGEQLGKFIGNNIAGIYNEVTKPSVDSDYLRSVTSGTPTMNKQDLANSAYGYSSGNTYIVNMDGTYIVDSDERMEEMGYKLRDVIARQDRLDGGLQ